MPGRTALPAASHILILGGLALCLLLRPNQTVVPASPGTPGCRFLEEELARRYRDAAPATLALLQERCEAVAQELIAADRKLQAAGDVVSLRRAGVWGWQSLDGLVFWHGRKEVWAAQGLQWRLRQLQTAAAHR